MGDDRYLLQDLDQVLSAELAGSAAARHELCQTHLAHDLSDAFARR